MKALLTASLLLLSSNVWAASIAVEDAYVRLMPPTQTVTGAFMVLKNASDDDRAVVSAESDVADKVELHTHQHENGVMKMRQVDQIEVPAGGETVLKPGGFHIMLIGLKQPLTLGQMVEIQMNMDDGSSTQVHAEVKSVMGGMGNMDGMNMKHDKMPKQMDN